MKHAAQDGSCWSRLPPKTCARRVSTFPNVRTCVLAAAVALCAAGGGPLAVAQVPGVQYLGPVEGGYPGTFAAWVYFNYPLSVDCSPPRACYAKSQWVYAHVNCQARIATAVQTISMDLNGDVVAIANWNDPEQFEHQRLGGSNMVDAGSRVLVRLCGVYVPDYEHPRRHRNVERTPPVPRQPK